MHVQRERGTEAVELGFLISREKYFSWHCEMAVVALSTLAEPRGRQSAAELVIVSLSLLIQYL